MERVKSLSDYFELINGTRAEKGMLRTNCMLFPDAVNRYIELGRLYVEKTEAGLLFYTDEERFYQLWFQIRPEIPFTVGKKDKPVLIQNVYKGEKKPWLSDVEKNMLNSGFILKDSMRHGVFTGYDQIPKIRRSLTAVEKIFKNEGFTFTPVRRSQMAELLEFRNNIPEVPYYQIPFFTEDEMIQEAKEERLCCVTDRVGQIIAARHLIVNGKKAYGWVGIREEYKALYGIALVFLGHALDYIVKNDIKMCSWVESTNIPSVQYHNRLGTEWTGHIEDEWLLES